MRKIISTIILTCLISIQFANAKTITYASNDKINGNINSSGNPNLVSWSSSKRLSVSLPQLSTSNNGSIINFKTKKLVSYVKLWLNTESIPSGLNSFTANVPVTITYYFENGPNVVVNKILEVDYDPTLGAKYKNVTLEQYENAYKIEVDYIANSIQLTNGTITATHRDFISMQAFIEHERYDNFNNVFGNSQYSNFTSNLLGVSTDILNREITFTWNAIPNAEGYEFEYTFIDNYGNLPGSIISANQINFSFKNNSTRILLKNNKHTMPLIQEQGYLVYRVRGYGMAGNNLDRIFFGNYGPTTGGTNPNQTFNVGTFPNRYLVVNERHTGDRINWQSVTSFAEEGKSKTVVQYMDGTMRNRQTVTSTSTERNAVVAEIIYDYQGRPAVTVLPTPTENAAIKYYPNFNQNLQGQPYSYKDFDFKGQNECDFFNINPLKQQSNIGAGNYYSQYNPNKTNFNAFIPEANGYPFTRVTYMPDPTDRVVRQGGLGEIFQPGNTNSTSYQGHDTKYYYGKPEQEKLDRLFGTNVGYAQFYQKNLVVDSNGQASVSYVDLDGKTIATALAGNAPKSLEKLESYESNFIKINLLSNNDIVDNNEHSITNTQSFLVSNNKTDYSFKYYFQGNNFNALSCSGSDYCLDCIYDLEITLVNDQCGKIEYSKIMTIGKLEDLNFICNDAQTTIDFDFSVNLNIGSYTITKKLIVNKTAAETYANNILNDPNNKCLKSYEEFYEEEWANRDQTRCLDACESCEKETQNSELTASQITNALKECEQWCNPQVANLCDIARTNIINDLTPQGQYAIYQDNNGNTALNSSPISILNQSANPNVKTLFNSPALTNTITISISGQQSQPLSYYLSTPNLLKYLIQNWPDDLSEKLASLHPEYCYLKFCDIQPVIASNNFDTKYMSADTFADAQAANIVNNINQFYNQDPLYNYLNSTLKNQMKNRFDNYAGANNSIVKLAVFAANCPSGNNLNSCPGVWANGINDDDEWLRFRNFYYAIKQEFIQKAREQYVQSSGGCCINNFVGCNLTDSQGNKTRNCNVSIIGQTNNNCSNPALQLLYGNAICRFPTINDVPFPNVNQTNTSIYDMSAEELANYVNSTTGNNNSACPSCPELDAFKLMVFHIQEKGWIQNNKSVKADEIVGLKEDLRTRFVGSQNNDNIIINRTSDKSFSVNSSKCNITFTSDEAIDFSKTSFIPTCLEISDYKNGKLHIMLDNGTKTTLTISSTCEIFYCTGSKPSENTTNNDCKCNSVYDIKTIYKLGDVVNYNGTCYIVKKATNQDKLATGRTPDLKEYWDKLCETTSNAECISPFILTFENPEQFNSDLATGTFPLQTNRYGITNNLSSPQSTIFPSKTLICRPSQNNQIIINKTASVIPNNNYRFSFIGNLLNANADNDEFRIEVYINNNLINTIFFPIPPTNSWQNYSYVWNSGNNTSVSVKLVSVKENQSDVFAIDNFRMDCATNLESQAKTVNNDNKNSKTKSIVNTSNESRYIPDNVCGCSMLCDTPEPSPELTFKSCEDILKEIATEQAQEAYATYRDSIFNKTLKGYYEKCIKSVEKFTMEYTDSEYHYTLYYYDQSGNLVRTVPPAGVKPFTTPTQLSNVVVSRLSNSTPQLPQHIMPTTYKHNALNAVVWQQTPDAGQSEFYYDKLGRIAISQNAKQKPNNVASYTYYDKLGRSVEVGQIDVLGINLKQKALDYLTWTNFINSRNRTEIVHTYYDQPANPRISSAFGNTGQKNLRNRIASIASFDSEAGLPSFVSTSLVAPDYNHATHYNYDVSGNVTEIYQDFGKYTMFGFNPNTIKTQSKHIAYNFDLISGKVNEVVYQKGFEDQFFYKYLYNADNKLTQVYTSDNGIIWENDARYSYYRHGPLARTEIGTDKIQGIDHVYNLQGWIKGVNGFSTSSATDIGQDGNNTSNGNIGYLNRNKTTSPDVFSYWLSYYQEDYQAIGNSNTSISNTTVDLNSGTYNTNPNNLYNGNIRSMYTNIQPFGGLGMQYNYDQLNRIKLQNAYSFTGATNSPASNDAYKMELNYDGNGNIQFMLRNGTVANTAMDYLKYTYYNNDNTTYTGNPTSTRATNRLASVSDSVNDTTHTADIDSQNAMNYTYDTIGNLTKDTKEGILNIDWNLQNKIKEIKKTDKTIGYFYDPLGNRVLKGVQDNTTNKMEKLELYVRDAQGNTLATYRNVSDSTFVKEQSIYGSSRLGVKTKEVITQANFYPINQTPVINTIDPSANLPRRKYHLNSYRNTTQYELNNHLGNVLATVTDAKNDNNSTSVATLTTATDYYAFGMAIPDRKFVMQGKEYRFGMNGQENDDDTFVGAMTAEFWEYDSRIGRRWNIDPIEEIGISSYCTFMNNPILLFDLKGNTPGDGDKNKLKTAQTYSSVTPIGTTLKEKSKPKYNLDEIKKVNSSQFLQAASNLNVQRVNNDFDGTIKNSEPLNANFDYGNFEYNLGVGYTKKGSPLSFNLELVNQDGISFEPSIEFNLAMPKGVRKIEINAGIGKDGINSTLLVDYSTSENSNVIYEYDVYKGNEFIKTVTLKDIVEENSIGFIKIIHVQRFAEENFKDGSRKTTLVKDVTFKKIEVSTEYFFLNGGVKVKTGETNNMAPVYKNFGDMLKK